VAVNSIYASIIPSYKYNLVLKSFSYGTQVMGHPVHATPLRYSDGPGSVGVQSGRLVVHLHQTGLQRIHVDDAQGLCRTGASRL
jgi:hypothetical protein